MAKFRVGDRVIHFGGEGEIIEIQENTIVVKGFDQKFYFNIEGKVSGSDIYPTLFHLDDKPKSWKRKVKKKITQWANIFSDGTSATYNSLEECAKDSSSTDIASCIELTGEYEIEK